MSTFKKFTSNDIIVTPFTVNKQFSYSGNAPSSNPSGAFAVNGKTGTFNPNYIGTSSAQLVFAQINHLYYSNYISGSNGNISLAATTSFNPDGTISGPFYTTNYDNFIQSVTESRYHSPTSFKLLSIPSKQFGEYIKPGSFSASGITDDGQGNLLNSSNQHIGNIIYKTGMVIHTGVEGAGGLNNFTDGTWESTITIYETQYKCTIHSNELNYSLNPSLLTTYGSGSILNSGSANYKDFATGSDFSPFVTSIGLYNDDQELLAVAKLAQPLQTSQTTDTTILINLDR